MRYHDDRSHVLNMNCSNPSRGVREYRGRSAAGPAVLDDSSQSDYEDHDQPAINERDGRFHLQVRGGVVNGPWY